jgi:hypothetical protein
MSGWTLPGLMDTTELFRHVLKRQSIAASTQLLGSIDLIANFTNTCPRNLRRRLVRLR